MHRASWQATSVAGVTAGDVLCQGHDAITAWHAPAWWPGNHAVRPKAQRRPTAQQPPARAAPVVLGLFHVSLLAMHFAVLKPGVLPCLAEYVQRYATPEKLGLHMVPKSDSEDGSGKMEDDDSDEGFLSSSEEEDD